MKNSGDQSIDITTQKLYCLTYRGEFGELYSDVIDEYKGVLFFTKNRNTIPTLRAAGLENCIESIEDSYVGLNISKLIVGKRVYIRYKRNSYDIVVIPIESLIIEEVIRTTINTKIY